MRSLLLLCMSMAAGCGSEQASGGAPASVLCDRNLGPVDGGVISEAGTISVCTATPGGNSQWVTVPVCLQLPLTEGGTSWFCCMQARDANIVLTTCR